MIREELRDTIPYVGGSPIAPQIREDTVKWYLRVLKKYAVFEGRARRKEYWWFFLVHWLIIAAVGLVQEVGAGTVLGDVAPLIGGSYVLGVFLPWLGVSVRRLHDRGLSGWWLLLNLVPYLGTIIVLVIFALDSESGENAYGPSPKEPAHV